MATVMASSPLPAASPAPQGSPLTPASAGLVPAKKGPDVKYGISAPISLQEATKADLDMSERMMKELEQEFPPETEAGMAHRQNVLIELEQIVIEWTMDVGRAQGMSEDEVLRCGVKVVTLGSYRLGVVHPETDIDTLCIGPPHINHWSFFGTAGSQPQQPPFLPDRLKEHKDVEECVSIPEAYTPIIKLKMHNVSIDLLFARLPKPLVGEGPLEELVKDDEVVKSMALQLDEKSVRSLNGYRVVDQILQLVPNQDTFRKTLRFVKCWARRRGINSNVLGFFGGITWALLVARVCQLYPHYAPSQLVNRFFRVYDQWNWGISKPVMLCETVEPPSGSQIKVWNPKTNPADKAHMMPVITPAFPAMNSTHNVTETTKRILLDEFRLGYEVVKSVEPLKEKGSWKKVYEPFPYFNKFRHFFSLEILAKSEEVYQKFAGWLISKLRILVQHLEGQRGMIVHPNPEQYDLKGRYTDWPLGCGVFIAMSFHKDQGARVGQTVDLRPTLSEWVDMVNEWPEKTSFSGLYVLKLKLLQGKELPDYAR